MLCRNNLGEDSCGDSCETGHLREVRGREVEVCTILLEEDCSIDCRRHPTLSKICFLTDKSKKISFAPSRVRRKKLIKPSTFYLWAYIPRDPKF